MTDPYVPYQVNGSWWFDDCFHKQRGPFVTEEACELRANSMRNSDEEKGLTL